MKSLNSRATLEAALSDMKLLIKTKLIFIVFLAFIGSISKRAIFVMRGIEVFSIFVIKAEKLGFFHFPYDSWLFQKRAYVATSLLQRL